MRWILLGLLWLPALAQATRGPSDPLPAGFRVFPASNVWNTSIEFAPVSSSNTLWIDIINGHAGHNLHADFGTTYLGNYNGIPYNIVYATDTKRVVTLGSYAAESDTQPVGGIPIPLDVIVEGDPEAAIGADRHLLLVDVSSHVLYELYASSRTGGGNWSAAQYTAFDLNGNFMRTQGITSADAAGMAVMPGLIRWDEIQAGVINHSIRFTLELTHGPYIWPASHDADSGDTWNPPFGMRVRLKSSFDQSGYSATNQIILTAMKKYGMILADNGGDWFFSGAPNPAWDPDDLALFVQIYPIDWMEVVDESTWMVSPDSYEAHVPGSRKVRGNATLKGGVKL